eukprot:1844063-Prymnesium_polylepis.1
MCIRDSRKGLDLARVRQVRPLAEVDERAVAVDSRRDTVGQLGRDHRHLERVARKELQALVLGDDDALERLLLVCDLRHLLLERRRHLACDRVAADERVVEEAALRGRAVREVRAIEALERLAEDVRRRVPEDLPAARVVKLGQLQLAVALERPRQIPQLPLGQVGLSPNTRHGSRRSILQLVDLGDSGGRAGEALLVAHTRDHNLLRQPLGDRDRHVERRGRPCSAIDCFAVGKCHGDRRLVELGHLGSVASSDVFQDGESRLHPRRVCRRRKRATDMLGASDLS